MKLKQMKDALISIEELEGEIQDRIDNIDWDRSDGEAWSDKCYQKEEFLSDGLDKINEIKEILNDLKESNLIDF